MPGHVSHTYIDPNSIYTGVLQVNDMPDAASLLHALNVQRLHLAAIPSPMAVSRIPLSSIVHGVPADRTMTAFLVHLESVVTMLPTIFSFQTSCLSVTFLQHLLGGHKLQDLRFYLLVATASVRAPV
jgi:hypothetical protein